VLLAAAFLARAERVQAQGDDIAGRAITDSKAIRRSAERAARSFEQYRLRLLPNLASPASDPGDIIIGRYRYAAGEADDMTPPPAEPTKIGEARKRLLRTLDSASRLTPGDEWLRSRLVWYLIEAGDTSAAIEAARGCRDTQVPWWCDALLGLTRHVAHQFVLAEQAFDRALAAMPDSTRCRWSDVTPLLDGDAEKLLRRTPCPGQRRTALNERLWWLADPLHAVEGNELRSEHFARHTFAVLHDRWRASHPLGWGSDMREIVLRYAWPIAWSRDRARERSPSQPGLWMALTGHEPRPAYDFLPDAGALQSPTDASDASWHLKRARATTHYAHPYAAPMRSLRRQIARFLRGDSLLIVGAWDASDDTLFARGVGRAALIASADDGRVRFVQSSDSATSRGVMTLSVPPADYLSSLELFAKESRAAARTRAGLQALRLTSGAALSDILLLEPGEHPRTFEDALHRVLPEAELGADRRVTLYWEVYRVAGVEAPRVTVAVSRLRASRIRRMAEKLGLRDEPQTAEMEWETDTPAAQRTAASVTLDLRDRPAGTWRVTIAVTGGGGEAASTSRDLVIR
jgi:hypothetical protein